LLSKTVEEKAWFLKAMGNPVIMAHWRLPGRNSSAANAAKPAALDCSEEPS
jgi:hypothetical protein